MSVRSLVVLFSLIAAWTANAYEVRNVSARQRWPWNSLIDVSYEIAGAAADAAYAVSLAATYDGGTKTIAGRTFRSDIVAKPGSNALVWDFGADAAGVKAADLRISVTATPLAADTAVYCVIDLSAGPTATRYPVRYTMEGPGHIQGSSNEVCQTTEMWLKRVAAGTFVFRSTDSNKKGLFTAKLTQALYAGVFECTQQQWYQVMGTWPSQFGDEQTRPSLPVETVGHALVLGQCDWPDDKTISANSFVGRIRARTGLATFNLPTEAQWEYVCRAGTTGSYACPTPRENYARCSQNSGGTPAVVGSYLPNNWGFYDTLGNVEEWTLDTYVANDDLTALYATEVAAAGFVTNPQGPENSVSSNDDHSVRGGSYSDTMNNGARPIDRSGQHSVDSKHGVRFVVTCE